MNLVFVDQEKNTNIAVVLYKKNIAKKPAINKNEKTKNIFFLFLL